MLAFTEINCLFYGSLIISESKREEILYLRAVVSQTKQNALDAR